MATTTGGHRGLRRSFRVWRGVAGSVALTAPSPTASINPQRTAVRAFAHAGVDVPR